MATSPLQLNFLYFDLPQSSSVSPLYLNPRHGFHSLITSRLVRLRIICCSSQTIEKFGTPEITFLKKKKKPRPTVLDKIQEKWSVKTTSFREKLPWQEDVEEKEETVENGLQFSGVEQLHSESDVSFDLNGSVVEFSSLNRGTFPPWVQEKKPTKPQIGSEIRKLVKSNERKAAIAGVHHSKGVSERLDFDYENGLDDGRNDGIPVGFSSFKRGAFPPWVQEKKPTKPQFGSEIRKLDKSNERDAAIVGVQHSKEVAESLDFDDEHGLNDVENDEIPVGFSSFKGATLPPWVQENKPTKPQFSSKTMNLDKKNENDAANDVQRSKEIAQRLHFDVKNGLDDARNNGTAVELPQEIQSLVLENNDAVHEFERHIMEIPHELSNVSSSSMRLPWEGEINSDTEHVDAKRLKKTHTDLAEKVVPEPELKRLRNMALRMVERIKVGEAGVTQALVNSIHKKWKVVEVVKLKFEGPPAKNMRRTHEVLESRTGGLVIWRSGSSIVLYRGMGYKLDCIQSYINQSRHNTKTSLSSEASGADVDRTTIINGSPTAADLPSFDSSKYSNSNLSGDELNDLQELNLVLDELGTRYESWSGREPYPVDADLLPARVHGYITPLRRLPYGIKQSLRDKEMTYLRQNAKQVPPHFALGRNRELQGLASAMVKLWEKSAIAKIAIKRGVQNTSNERMAEELKVLTGGTLLSRNKEYIVFYRGNDFLPSGISEALKEKEKVSEIRQDEEEKARKKAATLIDSKVKVIKRPLVAGTLAETKAATKRWSNQPSSEELEKMMKESAVARHASLVKLLVNKLAIAKGKITLAEKALGKMQEKMKSSDLPTDLETLTNEERFLFRKIGLSMKTYLPLGRREVFDGTIENMHLHWKHKELVKIIVDGKNLSQVKHIAISLEAESGGILVSVEKTNKGYAIIVYRGKNYQRPTTFRPKNLLTKRQALSRVTELQRREALKHHVLELQGKIKNLKSELEQMKLVKEIDEETMNSRMDGSSDNDNEFEEDEGSETNLETSDDEEEEDDLSWNGA